MEQGTLNIEQKSLSLSLSMGVYVILFLLGLWGCIAIYNATMFHMPFRYLGLQSIWLIVGMFALFFCSKVPFEQYMKYAVPLAVLSYLHMLLVLVWGVKINGMSGWFKVGSVMFQPSEFGKAPFILLLSVVCAKTQTARSHFCTLSSLAMLWVIPIMLQPDFGTMLVYLAD